MFAVIKMELSGKTVYGPVLKTTQLSAHAQNYASPERCRKSFTLIFLGDHDIPLTGSNFDTLTAYRAIFSRLFVFDCRSRPKYDTSRHFDPHFEEVGGGRTGSMYRIHTCVHMTANYSHISSFSTKVTRYCY